MGEDERDLRLSGIVDDFADIMTGASKTVTRYVHYRHELLWTHSIAAMLMALAVAGTTRAALNSPSFYLVRVIPGAPGSLAFLLGLGGFLLAIGLIFSWFNLKRVALGMLALFYLIIAASLSLPIYLWLTGVYPSRPILYGPLLYGHMAAIMVVHVIGTFRRSVKR